MLEIASLEGFYSKEPVQSSKRMRYSVEPYRTVPLDNRHLSYLGWKIHFVKAIFGYSLIFWEFLKKNTL